jgi:hypothetical protein
VGLAYKHSAPPSLLPKRWRLECGSRTCQIEGATGRFILQQIVVVAELEARMIGACTRAALAAAKRRAKKLGGYQGPATIRQDACAGPGSGPGSCGGTRCGIVADD